MITSRFPQRDGLIGTQETLRQSRSAYTTVMVVISRFTDIAEEAAACLWSANVCCVGMNEAEEEAIVLEAAVATTSGFRPR